MKNTLSIILFLLATTISFTSFSQNANMDPEEDNYISERSISMRTKAKHYTGSPYEDKEFKRGNVYKNKALMANNVALRYNVVRDEIEIKHNISTSNAAAKVLVKSPDIYIRIFNKLFVYVPKIGTERKGGYFMVLHEGEKYDLYKKIRKEFIEGKKAINSITKDVLPMYKEREVLLLVDNKGEMIELPRSKNGKLKLLSDKGKQVKKYVRDNRLNINKDYDLLKLIKYYNTL